MQGESVRGRLWKRLADWLVSPSAVALGEAPWENGDGVLLTGPEGVREDWRPPMPQVLPRLRDGRGAGDR